MELLVVLIIVLAIVITVTNIYIKASMNRNDDYLDKSVKSDEFTNSSEKKLKIVVPKSMGKFPCFYVYEKLIIIVLMQGKM